MRRNTWVFVGAVVVLAVAGTTTALVLSGGGGTSTYTALPTCDKVSAAVPGKPALQVGQNVTSAAEIKGLRPAYSNIRCQSEDGQTVVEVDLYQQSDMDLLTLGKYSDKQVHDGAWRAREVFGRNQLTELNTDTAYGSLDFADTTCSVAEVKGNADVLLTVPMAKGLPTDQWKAQCKQVAQTQMPKVMDAALG